MGLWFPEGREELGLSWMEEARLGGGDGTGGPLVERAWSSVWVDPPEGVHPYSGFIQLCGSG